MARKQRFSRLRRLPEPPRPPRLFYLCVCGLNFIERLSCLAFWLCHVARVGSDSQRHGSFSVTAREENRPPTRRRAPAHRPAAPPPNWQLRVARPAPGPQARALFAGAATIPQRGRALRLGPEPTDRVRGGARQNSQQLVPRPPDTPPVRDAPPPRALYFAPSLQPRSPASASAASAHRAAGRQLLSTQPAGAGRGARLR